MRIAIDIDGVLNYIADFQLRYGIPWFRARGIEVVNPNGFDIKDIFGCSDELRREFWKSTTPDGILIKDALIFDMARNTKMRPTFKELLKLLRDDGDHPYIVTERYGTDKKGIMGSYNRHLVYQWLKSFGIDLPKEDIVFVPEGKTKADVYREMDIDVCLEDNPKNISAIDSIDGLYAVVFNAPYNEGIEGEKIRRVDLPIDAYKYIREFENIKKAKAKQAKILRPGMFPPATGIPSKDRVWRQYYTAEEEDIEIPEMKMVDFLKQRAEQWPDAIMIQDDFGHKYTYHDFLYKLVPQYAKAFVNCGVKAGDPVVIALPNVIAVQAAKFALNQLGAIPVMANPLSKEDEFATYLDLDVHGKKPKVMLMFNRSVSTVKKAIQDNDIHLDHIISIGVDSDFNFPYNVGYKIKEGKNDPKPEEFEGLENVSSLKEFLKGGEAIESYEEKPYEKNDTAIIYFTGGTTGKEKAVECTNENAIAIAKQFSILIKDAKINDITMNAMPWFHVYGDMQIFFFAACNGMTNYPVPKFNRHSVDDYFDKDIINYNGVPAFLSATLANITDIADFSTVHHMISGGAALPYATQKALNLALRKSGSKASVEVGYGITEGSGGVCFTLVGEDEEGCIGIPTPGTNMKIVDPETGEELGYGQDGEICFSGPSVMKAYLNNPEETQKCLRVDDDGKIWLHSGDMGKVKENGLFYFSDRIKRMIIVSGENVYPNRIEKVIIDNFGDAVADCFVISKPDAAKGEVPTAKILLKPGVTPSVEIRDSILNTIKEAFPNKKYWPTGLDFIKSVPMTKMSKADFKKLNDPDLIIKLDDPEKVELPKKKEKRHRLSFYDVAKKVYSLLPKYKRKIKIIGQENLPTDGATIVAMNHLNAQDQNAIMSTVDRVVSLPAKKEYFDGKISGWFMRKLEMIPVDRFGDTLYARDWIKGILETSKLDDYEVDRPVIDELISYVDSLKIGPKDIKNVKELVNTILEHIIENYDNKLGREVFDRIVEMPTSGVENGYGRTLKVNQEVSQRLSEGKMIGVFPEGTRNSDFLETGELLRFHSGTVRWARDSFAAIIPTAITGEHKRGGEVLVRYGEPMKIDPNLDEEGVRKATQELQEKVYELVLLNLVDQDNPDNNKALESAIKRLKANDDEKSRELLEMINAQLALNDSERNESFRRMI